MMRTSTSIVMLAALMGLLPACASDSAISTDRSRAVTLTNSLAPPDAVMTDTSLERDYRIGPLDELDVSVFGVDQLKSSVKVDALGRIALPLVGTVDAEGKTTDQLEADISGKMSAFVRSPQVSVFVKQAQSQKITIEGSVTQPGVYPLTGRTTLLEALAMAHGIDRFAKLDQIVVFRTVDGNRMAARFNAAAIRNGQYADPEVYGNDFIEVNQNAGKRTLYDLVELLPLADVFRFIP
jgi:polysaccharide export outer membrane protein